MFTIDTLVGHERMSTQDLLLAIGQAVAQGETEFEIHASGQHDIGGPLWHPEGKKLFFHVTNAGQRVGCMCLDNTEIVVDESSSADVGWLNAGGKSLFAVMLVIQLVIVLLAVKFISVVEQVLVLVHL